MNTSNLEVIPEKLKIDLIKKSHAGDKHARDKLIEGNLKLVLRIVQKFAGRSESVDDLFQIGTIGLIKAVDNFDISHNTIRKINFDFTNYIILFEFAMICVN